MSSLQNQITQFLDGHSDDSLSINYNVAVREKKRRLGSMKGQKFIADGHNIDECNDEISELFGVNG